MRKITAPLPIMHGEDDPQAPPYESQQFVAALKKAGKTHRFLPMETVGLQPTEEIGIARRLCERNPLLQYWVK